MTDAPATNRQLLLRQRPVGLLTRDDLESVDGPVPELAEGEALMRTEYVAMDATMRSWLNSSDGYLPAVEIGEVVRAATAGHIVATRCPAYEVGDKVTSLTGAQQYGVVRDDVFTTKLRPDMDLQALFALYNSSGVTAYVGTLDVGALQAGETFVVSAAAGSTGSIAGQIAKIRGARVVGIAGSAEKCRYVVEELGFDACIDHRSDDLAAALREHCPKRVDVYFDNVGGRVLDAVLGRLAMHARVVLCGAISVYNDTHKPPGPANYLNLIQQRARMEGFIAFDSWGRYDEICDQLRVWVDEGRMKWRAHVHDGLDATVDALNSLFTGDNIGKVMVRVE